MKSHLLRRWLSGGAALAVALALLATSGLICAQAKKPKKWAGVWTDPADSTLPADFKYQGEYAGECKKGNKLGCQVIALDKGYFQAVVYLGGLPGAGWDRKTRTLMDGKLDSEAGKVSFTPVKADSKRGYKKRKPEEFLAVSKLPTGHNSYTATISGDTLTGKTEDGTEFTLKKTERKSPTLGMKPPSDAVVLFDGTDTKEWNGGRLDEKTKLLNTDGSDIRTKRKFNNYRVHLEFLLPFRPSERDQGRGNSGFYQVDLYEVQILDSFGLEGKNNECGGIYSKRDSDLNMCLPPLTWQTYDIEFTNAVKDPATGQKKNARITVKLNGVVIHDNVEIKGTTNGGRDPKEDGTPGPFRLQGHGNPLQFRNMWVVETK